MIFDNLYNEPYNNFTNPVIKFNHYEVSSILSQNKLCFLLFKLINIKTTYLVLCRRNIYFIFSITTHNK